MDEIKEVEAVLDSVVVEETLDVLVTGVELLAVVVVAVETELVIMTLLKAEVELLTAGVGVLTGTVLEAEPQLKPME